jgi:hypothetical protein
MAATRVRGGGIGRREMRHGGPVIVDYSTPEPPWIGLQLLARQRGRV